MPFASMCKCFLAQLWMPSLLPCQLSTSGLWLSMIPMLPACAPSKRSAINVITGVDYCSRSTCAVECAIQLCEIHKKPPLCPMCRRKIQGFHIVK